MKCVLSKKVANEAFEEATSIDNEFAVQNGTVQAALDKAKNKLHETSVELGKEFAPLMQASINSTTLFMKATVILVKFLNEYKNILIPLVTGITSLTVAINFAAIKQKILCAWTTASTVAQKGFNAALKANPYAWAAALIGTLITALILLSKRTDDVTAAQKRLNGIRKDAEDQTKEETNKVKLLAEAARNESLSLRQRQTAIEELNKLIPDYNGFLDETTGKYTENKKALDDYIESLIRQAEIEGAKGQLADIGKQKAQLKTQRAESQQNLNNALAQRSNTPARAIGTSTVGVVQFNTDGIDHVISQEKGVINGIDRQLKRLEMQEKLITDTYGNEIQESVINEATETTDGTGGDGGGGSGNDDKDADKARKKRIQNALKAVEEINTMEQAKNAIAYSEGEIDYAKYCEVKKVLEEKLLDDKIKALEKINETDSSEYGNLLIKKAEKKAKADEDAAKQEKKAQEQNRARSLQDAEAQYEQEKDCALDMYLDQNSAIYQNEKAYKQLLFDMEVAYLKKRMALYEEDSKERLDLERKLNAAIKKDQTDKQQEAINKRKQFDQDYNTDKLSQYSESLSKIDQLEEEGIITSAEATHAKLKELSSFLAAEGQEFSASIITLTDTIFSALNDIGGSSMDIMNAGFGVF